VCNFALLIPSWNNISQAMRKMYGYLRAPGAKVPPKWYLYHRHAECLDRINNSLPPVAAGQGKKDHHVLCSLFYNKNINTKMLEKQLVDLFEQCCSCVYVKNFHNNSHKVFFTRKNKKYF